MKNWIVAIIISILLLFEGCCPSVTTKTEYITKYDTVTVFKDGRIDTVTLRNDFTGENIRYIVRVDTLLKKVFINAKPETLKVIIRDTVTINNTVVKDDGFFQGITLKDIMIFIGVLFGLALVINLIKK